MIIKSAIVFLRIFDSVCDLYEWGQKIFQEIFKKTIVFRRYPKKPSTGIYHYSTIKLSIPLFNQEIPCEACFQFINM